MGIHAHRIVARRRSAVTTFLAGAGAPGKVGLCARVSTSGARWTFNHLLLPVVAFFMLLSALPAHARVLYVDHDSRGGTCSDAVSGDMNDSAKGARPWCTLGAAGKAVRAGDVVLVR